MERIFLRDVAGLRAGEIRELDWDFFMQSARVHHGVTDPLDSYSLPVEEAARRYVAMLTPKADREKSVLLGEIHEHGQSITPSLLAGRRRAP